MGYEEFKKQFNDLCDEEKKTANWVQNLCCHEKIKALLSPFGLLISFKQRSQSSIALTLNPLQSTSYFEQTPFEVAGYILQSLKISVSLIININEADNSVEDFKTGILHFLNNNRSFIVSFSWKELPAKVSSTHFLARDIYFLNKLLYVLTQLPLLEELHLPNLIAEPDNQETSDNAVEVLFSWLANNPLNIKIVSIGKTEFIRPKTYELFAKMIQNNTRLIEFSFEDEMWFRILEKEEHTQAIQLMKAAFEKNYVLSILSFPNTFFYYSTPADIQEKKPDLLPIFLLQLMHFFSTLLHSRYLSSIGHCCDRDTTVVNTGCDIDANLPYDADSIPIPMFTSPIFYINSVNGLMMVANPIAALLEVKKHWLEIEEKSTVFLEDSGGIIMFQDYCEYAKKLTDMVRHGLDIYFKYKEAESDECISAVVILEELACLTSKFHNLEDNLAIKIYDLEINPLLLKAKELFIQIEECSDIFVLQLSFEEAKKLIDNIKNKLEIYRKYIKNTSSKYELIQKELACLEKKIRGRLNFEISALLREARNLWLKIKQQNGAGPDIFALQQFCNEARRLKNIIKSDLEICSEHKENEKTEYLLAQRELTYLETRIHDSQSIIDNYFNELHIKHKNSKNPKGLTATSPLDELAQYVIDTYLSQPYANIRVSNSLNNDEKIKRFYHGVPHAVTSALLVPKCLEFIRKYLSHLWVQLNVNKDGEVKLTISDNYFLQSTVIDKPLTVQENKWLQLLVLWHDAGNRQEADADEQFLAELFHKEASLLGLPLEYRDQLTKALIFKNLVCYNDYQIVLQLCDAIEILRVIPFAQFDVEQLVLIKLLRSISSDYYHADYLLKQAVKEIKDFAECYSILMGILYLPDIRLYCEGVNCITIIKHIVYTFRLWNIIIPEYKQKLIFLENIKNNTIDIKKILIPEHFLPDNEESWQSIWARPISSKELRQYYEFILAPLEHLSDESLLKLYQNGGIYARVHLRSGTETSVLSELTIVGKNKQVLEEKKINSPNEVATHFNSSKNFFNNNLLFRPVVFISSTAPIKIFSSEDAGVFLDGNIDQLFKYKENCYSKYIGLDSYQLDRTPDRLKCIPNDSLIEKYREMEYRRSDPLEDDNVHYYGRYAFENNETLSLYRIANIIGYHVAPNLASARDALLLALIYISNGRSCPFLQFHPYIGPQKVKLSDVIDWSEGIFHEEKFIINAVEKNLKLYNIIYSNSDSLYHYLKKILDDKKVVIELQEEKQDDGSIVPTYHANVDHYSAKAYMLLAGKFKVPVFEVDGKRFFDKNGFLVYIAKRFFSHESHVVIRNISSYFSHLNINLNVDAHGDVESDIQLNFLGSLFYIKKINNPRRGEKAALLLRTKFPHFESIKKFLELRQYRVAPFKNDAEIDLFSIDPDEEIKRVKPFNLSLLSLFKKKENLKSLVDETEESLHIKLKQSIF